MQSRKIWGNVENLYVLKWFLSCINILAKFLAIQALSNFQYWFGKIIDRIIG